MTTPPAKAGSPLEVLMGMPQSLSVFWLSSYQRDKILSHLWDLLLSQTPPAERVA